MFFLGDTGFGESYGDINLNEKGYDYSFKNFKQILESADYTVMNLETPLTTPDKPHLEKTYVHWSDPIKGTLELKNEGVDLVGLANNHTMDYGIDGLKQTFEVLKENEIAWVGAALNDEDAIAPFVKNFTVEDKKVSIVIIAVYSGPKGIDSAKIASQIKDLKNKNKDIFVIVFPHWGNNYEDRTEKQQKKAYELIDAGADMIIGHGAHMLQEIEKYKGSLIVYSLGNFVFNSPGRYKSMDAPPFSLIAKLLVDENDFNLKLYPIFTDNLQTDYQGRFVTEDEFGEVVKLLKLDGQTGEDEFGRYVLY